MNRRGQLLLRWGSLAAAAALVAGAAAARLGRRADPAALPEEGPVEGLTAVLERRLPADRVGLRFREVGATCGLSFRHFPSVRRSLLPEDMGSGLAFADVDEDGDPDLFLVNFCASLDEECGSNEEGRCRFFVNEGGAFSDRTDEAGLGLRIRGMGACFFDADGDGDLDLYVTAFGRNRLLRRGEGGVYTDATDATGTGDGRFGAGVAVGDPDLDGDLDLYVCNYVDFRIREGDRGRRSLQYGSEIPFTLNPSSFPAQPNVLYVNDGSGRFTDEAEARGVQDAEGRSLGAVFFDFDLDGGPDLYVANDVSRNGVYRNLGDGRFEDVGAATLAADYRGAMGLAVSDLGSDGDPDLFVTHWIAQENALFENVERARDGRRFFADMSEAYGLGQVSLATVGWSCGFADFDLDGTDDLWVVNGSTLERRDDPSRLVAQPLHLFQGVEGRGFFEVARTACPLLERPIVGRGGAAADLDGDGLLDLVVAVHGGRPLVLKNTSPASGRHFLVVRLRQDPPNPRALGATVVLRTGDRRVVRWIGADGAYLSQHPAEAHFGLGAVTRPAGLDVRWPDGEWERFEIPAVDRTVTLRRGEGAPRPAR